MSFEVSPTRQKKPNNAHDCPVTLNTLVIEIIVELHKRLRTHAKVSLWLYTKNIHFGGNTPLSLIAKGRADKVRDFILTGSVR